MMASGWYWFIVVSLVYLVVEGIENRPTKTFSLIICLCLALMAIIGSTNEILKRLDAIQKACQCQGVTR